MLFPEDVCGENANFDGMKMKTCKEHLNGKGLMWYGDAGQIQFTTDPAIGINIEDLEMDGNINKLFDLSKPIYRATTDEMEQYDTSIYGCKVTNDPRYRLGRICYGLGKDETGGKLIPVSLYLVL